MLVDDKLGARVEHKGYFGTVRYVGPVEGYDGLWLGVDWDDPKRGKHNGTVNGVHYFDASSPTSGSLARKNAVYFGQSLTEAVRWRYGSEQDSQTAIQSEQQLISFQKDINAPFIQLVGFEKVAKKQKEFDSLQVINVRGSLVSSMGLRGELLELCPNIRELDISKNLLATWDVVFSICLELKHLYWLNVSENLLTPPPKRMEYTFPNVTVLICNHMKLTWDQVIDLSSAFPNVSELRLACNKISELTTPADHNFKNLRYLVLEGNDIKYWSEVNKLAVVENLEHLVLEDVKLESIKVEPGTFTTLKTLNLNNNLISDWRSVGELNKMGSLHHLRFKNNPVLETEIPATSHQILIAKIKTLTILNGTIIKIEERKGADYDYVKKYALEWLKVKDDPVERGSFLDQHNRYLELIEEYGFPELSELVVKQNVIESTLITVFFFYEGRSVEKRIPYSISIQKLILLAQKLFKLSSRPTLKLVSSESSEIVMDLSDNLKEIGYYSVQNGDTILVEA